MNPWQLAGDSESSQQIALFCFLAKAKKYGFELAKNPKAYESSFKVMQAIPIDNYDKEVGSVFIPELDWLFHIPNGGKRGDSARSAAIAGGQLKAEGVKAGVMDIMWPLKRSVWSGLIVEMKAPRLKSAKNHLAGCSPEQIAFGEFAHNNGYAVHVSYTWLEAAEIIEWYYRQ